MLVGDVLVGLVTRKDEHCKKKAFFSLKFKQKKHSCCNMAMDICASVGTLEPSKNQTNPRDLSCFLFVFLILLGAQKKIHIHGMKFKSQMCF